MGDLVDLAAERAKRRPKPWMQGGHAVTGPNVTGGAVFTHTWGQPVEGKKGDTYLQVGREVQLWWHNGERWEHAQQQLPGTEEDA